MIATRIKEFNANFALYKLEGLNIRVIDESGRDIEFPHNFNGVIAVREIQFCGWAKGKTGAHRLDADNTKMIEVHQCRKTNKGFEAHRWVLQNQNKIDEEYRKLREFNI